MGADVVHLFTDVKTAGMSDVYKITITSVQIRPSLVVQDIVFAAIRMRKPHWIRG